MKNLLPLTLVTIVTSIPFAYSDPEPERSPAYRPQELPSQDLTDVLDAHYGFIYFSIDGCPACRRALPRFQALEQRAEDACISSDVLDFEYVNLSQARPEPADFIREDIEYVPTVIEIQRGTEVGRYVGAGEAFDQLETRVHWLIDWYQR